MGHQKQPNFIFILVDDLGWKDLGTYGSSFYETPNLDKLAKEGISFSDAYAACPVCSPTRASILTGKYPATLQLTNYLSGHETGKLISAPYIKHLPLEEKTIASALKEHGYHTYHIGKWHLGPEPYYPEHHGFDKNIGGCKWGMPAFGYFSPYRNPRLSDGPKGEYLTDRLTDEALNLLQTKDETPFFMYLSYYSVHVPIQAPKDLVEKYKAKAKKLGLDKVKTFEKGEYFPCDHKKHKRVKRRLLQSDPTYAAMVERLDWNIGRIFKVLKHSGLEEDTVVFFTSDNGGLATAEGSPTCNSPLAEGKGWMYEGGTREPLIIRWPGHHAQGIKCETPITSPDFYPTILEMAGLPSMPEQHTDGESILPIIENTGKLTRDAIFWHYPHYGNQGGSPGSSIRQGDYKLIEFFEDKHVELYNLHEDIGEDYNLAGEKPELAARMQQRLQSWREAVEARIPLQNPDYSPRRWELRSKYRWLKALFRNQKEE
jgi:arylsulfatase A-like enzyme